MKTKTKLVLSICALTLIFSACNKDSVKPEDCIGVENGVAVMDDCGECHQSYIYDYINHVPTYIEDTAELVLGATEMLVLAGSANDTASNPNWNASCTDCSGILNGSAIIDDCEDCHKWLAYNYVTHATREVNDTITEILLENEMFTSPNNNMNPLWNAGCK